MTEAEWLSWWKSLADITRMANQIVSFASKRKLRLLACACCRRAWSSLTPVTREWLVLAEKHADRKANPKALPSKQAALPLLDGLSLAVHEAASRHHNARVLISSVAHARSGVAFAAPEEEFSEAWATETEAQLELVREIFGNPFRPVTVKSSWLTPTVMGLAETTYQERAFDRMPILADALEDAGCANADILTHCRGGGAHVRGCWVIDLLTGRQWTPPPVR